MNGQGKIGAFSFFCALFTCRIIALVTFVITDRERFPAGDRTVIFLPFLLTGLACCVPVLLLVGKHGENTLFTRTDSLSPALSKAMAVLYAAGAVWSAGVSLVRFDLFMSTVMFSGAELFGPVLLLACAAVWTARQGVEVTARMSVAVLALVAASLLYVGLTTAKEFDAANLEPPLQNGVLPLMENSFSAVARTGELAALLVLAPRVKGDLRRGAFFWFLSFGLTVSVLYTLISGVTGEYGERQMFQLYALTVLSKIGAVERLDALICAIWVLCSLVRLSFHLQAAGLFLEGGLHLPPKTPVLAGLGAAALAVYLPLSRSITAFSGAVRSGVNEALFTLLLIVLPCAVLIADAVKTRRTKALRRESA